MSYEKNDIPAILARCESPSLSVWQHARTDVPALCAEVLELREEVRMLRAQSNAIDEALNSGDGSYRP